MAYALLPASASPTPTPRCPRPKDSSPRARTCSTTGGDLSTRARHLHALRRAHLLKAHAAHPPQPFSKSIVVLSDTHGAQPSDIPPADILIHAGDISSSCTRQRLQDQLDWLNSLPHPHKILIAGNHDTFLDPALGSSGTDPKPPRDQLNWGSLIYLHDSSTTLSFKDGTRIKVYGSPRTPRFGTPAFQYAKSHDAWTDAVPLDTDILVTHGPAKFYQDGVGNYGDPNLLAELWRVKPRLFVHGHIHEGAGRDVLVYDAFQKAYEDILGGECSVGDMLALVCAMLVYAVFARFPVATAAAAAAAPPGVSKQTVVVNAALNKAGKKGESSGPFVEHWI